MSLLLENLYKTKQQRSHSAQRDCSSQGEWRALHIQSEAAGKELQEDYANPWLGEQGLIARAGDAHTACTWVVIMQITPPQPGSRAIG